MGKSVFIAEKPSVARQFADALDLEWSTARTDGYRVSKDGNVIVTWCVGHLVTMSYPDAYDPKYKKWSLETIPFIPDEFRYQVIDSVKKQYGIVKSILTSKDVSTIYICTDSGREGEYIYRLVARQAGVTGKDERRVWINSQTKEEILRGIREAKSDSAYDNLGNAAYLRAKEDYLMGINFSRALTLRYGYTLQKFLGADRCVIAVGRVMTCVLGMIVNREREIRSFVKTPFYRVVVQLTKQASDPGTRESGAAVITAEGILPGNAAQEPDTPALKQPRFEAEWHDCESSIYHGTPKLYRENGLRDREDAEKLIQYLIHGNGPDSSGNAAGIPAVEQITKKTENRRPPLLYNLAELQNDCSRFLKISPDQTLDAAQELYEKKLTTYPRTDARVLSSAVAKEITKNLNGIFRMPMYKDYVKEIAAFGSAKTIGKTRYTDDSAITDHYAIIPTGQGLNALSSCSPTVQKVYELIVRRFLAIFYPNAVFDRIAMQVRIRTELFSASVRTCREEGYLKVCQYSFFRRQNKNTAAESGSAADNGAAAGENGGNGDDADAGVMSDSPALSAFFRTLKKGTRLSAERFAVKEGETKPPSRYNSGSMILAMENAGQLIEDDELREQIRGSGIGTSATRAEILKKLVTNRYIALNKKTQIYTPTQLGEMIYDTVRCSIAPLLDPKLTASWEKGLSGVAEGTVTGDEYMDKLKGYVVRRTEFVKNTDYREPLLKQFEYVRQFYKPQNWNFGGGKYHKQKQKGD